MRLKLIACLFGAVLCGPLRAEDLLGVYREAVAQDPTFAAARASYVAAKERLVQGRALLLPNVNATGNVNYNSIENDYRNPTPNIAQGRFDYESYGAGVNLTQPVYQPTRKAQYDQAGIQVVQAQDQLSRAGQELMLRVAQAYFDVLLAQFDLVTVEAQKAATAEQLAQAKRNFEVGTATITDTYDAQARYDLIVAREIASRNDIEVRTRALQQIIGRPPGPLSTLLGPVTLNPPQPNDMEKWVEAAYTDSLQIKVARATVDIAEKEVDRTRYAHHPTVDAVGSANFNYQGDTQIGTGALDTTNLVIGLQLAVPIYSGGALSSRVREAIANRTRSEQDLETARRSVAQETRTAFLAVNTGLSEITALQQAVASNKLSVEASKLGQEVGVRTQVDVLNAQGLLYQAQRDLADAYYRAIVSQLRLKAAVGRLTEADIDNVNRLLTPSTKQ